MQSRFLQSLAPEHAPHTALYPGTNVQNSCNIYSYAIYIVITNIHIIHLHLCVYVKFTADFFGYLCFLKMFKSNEFTEKKNRENTTKENEHGAPLR